MPAVAQKSATTPAEPLLVYDRQCPVCDYYCHLLCTSENSERLTLVDARNDTRVLREITARGLDIDQGMVLRANGRLYYGADAIREFALILRPDTMLHRVNRWIFRAPSRARVIYPILRAGRNFLLKLLGRTKINNLGLPGNDRF